MLPCPAARVISRIRISYGPWRPYLTKILSPRRWVWSVGTPVLGQGGALDRHGARRFGE